LNPELVWTVFTDEDRVLTTSFRKHMTTYCTSRDSVPTLLFRVQICTEAAEISPVGRWGLSAVEASHSAYCWPHPACFRQRKCWSAAKANTSNIRLNRMARRWVKLWNFFPGPQYSIFKHIKIVFIYLFYDSVLTAMHI
jgi:hypothetical protein